MSESEKKFFHLDEKFDDIKKTNFDLTTNIEEKYVPSLLYPGLEAMRQSVQMVNYIPYKQGCKLVPDREKINDLYDGYIRLLEQSRSKLLALCNDPIVLKDDA